MPKIDDLVHSSPEIDTLKLFQPNRLAGIFVVSHTPDVSAIDVSS